MVNSPVQNMDIERRDWGFGQNSRISSPDVAWSWLGPHSISGVHCFDTCFSEVENLCGRRSYPKEGPLFSWIQYSSDTIKPWFQWRLCDIHQGVTRLPSGHQTSRAVKSTIGFAIFPAINPIFCSFFPARGYPPVNQHRCGKAYHLKILFLEKHW